MPVLLRAMWVGVDVGARQFHVVVINGRYEIRRAEVVPVLELAHLVRMLRRAKAVVIDSPGAWSTAPHAGDETVAAKFRLGRCSEIDLGRRFGIWVPWSTPPEPAPGTWMASGIALFDALRAEGHDPVEGFPYGGFRVLAGGRLPKKTTAEGRVARAALLRSAGVEVNGLERSHDFIDAALVALVARQRSLGTAQVATCGHDQSGIWLPARAATAAFSGQQSVESAGGCPQNGGSAAAVAEASGAALRR
jgi:predicted nuclease with RNAse H fold